MLHPIALASISFAVALVLIFLLVQPRLARFALDQPNARSLHARSVPRSGGVAVCAGLLAGWAFAAPPASWSLAAAAVCLALLSLIDDMRRLPIVARLLAHLAAASAAVLQVLGPDAEVIWTLAAILAVTWMTNLYNFMDGADGLAGGMTLLGFACYAIAAWDVGHSAFGYANLAIAASSAAFLVFNFHPARIFLGDVGSIPLGFLAAVCGLIGWSNGSWQIWFPVLVFSPFIVDATATLAHRVFSGKRFWEAHRDHYYQKLVQLGWGHRKTVLAEYGLMLACGALGLLARHLGSAGQMAVIVSTLVLYAVLIVVLNLIWRRSGLKGAA